MSASIALVNLDKGYSFRANEIRARTPLPDALQTPAGTPADP
jgi:hypothetical protein